MTTFLVLVVALIATLLLAPVRIHVDVDTRRPARRIHTRVRWLLVRWESGRSRKARQRSTPPASTRATRRRPASRFRAGLIHALLRSPGFINRLVRLLAELSRPLRPIGARGAVTFGLDDPALTGGLVGALCAMRLWPGHCWRDVRLVPVFSEPSFDVRGQATWAIRPGRLLWPVATFLTAPVVWRAARAALRARSGTGQRAVAFGRASAFAKSQLA